MEPSRRLNAECTFSGYVRTFTYLHVCVVYAHAAEYGESFHKVFVVFREHQFVELVDQLRTRETKHNFYCYYFFLFFIVSRDDERTFVIRYLYHADDLAGRILNRHAQHGGVFEPGVFVHRLVEPRIVVSAGDVDRLENKPTYGSKEKKKER